MKKIPNSLVVLVAIVHLGFGLYSGISSGHSMPVVWAFFRVALGLGLILYDYDAYYALYPVKRHPEVELLCRLAGWAILVIPLVEQILNILFFQRMYEAAWQYIFGMK